MIFAHAIAKLGPLTPSIGGQIGFAISGDGGGRWILDLDAPGGVWSSWDEYELVPATTVDARSEAFSALILDPERALDDDTLLVRGDRTKLRRLAELIRGGGSLLSQRARTQSERRTR